MFHFENSLKRFHPVNMGVMCSNHFVFSTVLSCSKLCTSHCVLSSWPDESITFSFALLEHGGVDGNSCCFCIENLRKHVCSLFFYFAFTRD